MASAIDHIVIAVTDPDAAAAELTETVGLAFTGGGRHTGLGTFNRIAFLGDAYLELLGVDDATLASGWAVGAAAVRALEGGGGFVTYALVDDGIRTSVARLQANGSRIGPVVHLGRERSDGERVEWWSAATPQLGPELPPFLIKHLYAGAEWGADALAARRSFVHPIGAPVRLAGIELRLADPLDLAAACARDVGLEFGALGETGAAGAAASVGPHPIVLTGGLPGARAVLSAAVPPPGRTVSAVGIELVVRATAMTAV